MNNCWMIRAGDGNQLIDLFSKGYVLIGWPDLGDLKVYPSKDALRQQYRCIWPKEPEGKVNGSVSMLWKFRNEVVSGDKVLTYDQLRREYLYGEVISDYQYDTKLNKPYPHKHEVKWLTRISRDALKISSRNSLGGALTLFSVNEEIREDLAKAAANPKSPQVNPLVTSESKQHKEEFSEIQRDTKAKSFELIKDALANLDDEELPELVAAVLRAMGFKTKVSPPGSDRGVDVLASPDGLGLTEPRIKVEVKHRKQTQMNAQEIRKFLGGFRAGDRGLYVSSGGFTKDARYEADRAQFPISLLDLDGVTEWVIENYEKFDAEGRALINLVRVYFPN